MTARLVGKHCESGDVLSFEARLPADLAVGDLLAMPVTGAYGHSMGSNYNKITRPPVVFVADGQARLVVPRDVRRPARHHDLADRPASVESVEVAQHGSTARRQFVAGAVADGQTQRLELADVVLGTGRCRGRAMQRGRGRARAVGRR